jgi:hypothetical protein
LKNWLIETILKTSGEYSTNYLNEIYFLKKLQFGLKKWGSWGSIKLRWVGYNIIISKNESESSQRFTYNGLMDIDPTP